MDSTFGWIGISWWLVVGSISIQSLLPWECCHKLWVQQGARSWDMFWTPILWGHICLVISSFLNDLGVTILKECGSTLVARAATTIETGEADRFDCLLEICRHIGCSGAPSYLCGSLIAMHGKCICSTSWGWECFRGLNTAKLLLVNEVYPFDTVHERQKKSASYINLSDLGMGQSQNRIHTHIYIYMFLYITYLWGMKQRPFNSYFGVLEVSGIYWNISWMNTTFSDDIWNEPEQI